MKTEQYNVSELSCGEILHDYFPQFFSLEDGIKVTKELRHETGFALHCSTEQVLICADSVSSQMTALGALASGRELDGCEVSIEFPFRGLMLDASRNAVPTVTALKERLVTLALLGMNYFCLYTEDTFTVDNHQLIGYKRGRYSKEEIRELVELAEQIGITIFPCFQTLGHLEQVLRYQSYTDLQDTHRVLNVTSDKVYELIETLIDEVTEPYTTDLIHLGMDEPWGLGYGKAYNQESPVPPNELYVEHVKRVVEMCDARGLKPIIWGDFVLGRSDNRALSKEQREAIPQQCSLAYWNYFDTEPDHYRDHLKTIHDSGYETIIAPGLHTWNRFFPDISFAKNTFKACLESIKGQGARVMETIWGDDGHECLFDTNWSSLFSYFSLLTFGDYSHDYGKNFFNNLYSTDISLFSCLEELEENLGVFSTNPKFPASKMIFYDDPLLGVACAASDCSYVRELCRKCSEKLQAASAVDKKFSNLSRLMKLYLECIEGKVNLYEKSREAYKLNNVEELQRILVECEQLTTSYQQFAETYRKLWDDERKLFGYEIVDGRFGAMIARLDSFNYTLKRYLTREIPSIEPFDEPDIELQPRDMQFYSHAQTRCFSIW